MKKQLILYDEDGSEKALPFKWEICEACEGHGLSSSYLGAFTRSDMDEMGEEFMEDYFVGRLDRPCDHCENGKVKVIDERRVSKADLDAWEKQVAGDEECEAIHRQERLMEGGWREEGWFE